MAPIEEKIRKPPVQWESVRDETAKEKLLRKVKGNPFIPIGRLSAHEMNYFVDGPW